MARKVSLYAVFIALGIVAGYIENTIPLPIAIPGVKLGVANIIVVISLYFLGIKPAFVISVLRIVLLSFLWGNPNMLMYSLAGGLLSFVAMVIFKKLKIFGIIAVSVMGGFFHIVGQVAVAAMVLQDLNISYVGPILLVSGTITGVLVGIAAQYTLKYLYKSKIKGL